ncbi:MAG TPA: diguanylate cyclase [Solirubrobacteraceae bacterium]|nr:diguanylate cyclase [Solirubrobacteraceae bacterium]
MSAVLLARVRAFGGDDAVAEVLRLAGSKRTAAYLCDITNWIAYDEAVALWGAGGLVTHHPQFAHAVGEDTARRLSGSQVASMLRSLGSPENVYGAIATSTAEFSTATKLDVTDSGPGFADVVAVAAGGFPRSPDHCEWTRGLLTCGTVLFGQGPAIVEHETCQAMGAPCCVYRVRWDVEAEAPGGSPEKIAALQHQLDATTERLHSVFAAASDLIAADDLDDVLARITARAALEVRANRYLLAVQVGPGGELHCHHKGFEQEGVAEYVDELLHRRPPTHPDSWLVVPVRSNRREYGWLLALRPTGQKFLAQERELFEVYAHYAATALDGASALMEAKRRSEQSSALLSLARALAAAGTSREVATRLADAVPLVVDCDRVGVCLWDAAHGVLVRRAVTTTRDGTVDAEETMWDPIPGTPLHRMIKDLSLEPLFVDETIDDPQLLEMLLALGLAATILVPLVSADSFLGLLIVSVFDHPERLRPAPDLLDRLSGVAAQATTALQNGRLVDEMTHQAMHDQLTGLANRLQFTGQLRDVIYRARKEIQPVTLLYMDLDGFKPVNDEFGHDVGDHLLVAVAKRLASCTRAEDTVARLGGDEFAVLIDSKTAPADAEDVSDRLAAAVTRPFVIDGHRLHLGISIGRAVFPIDAEDADGLLRCADAAMFSVKRSTYARALHAGRTR